MSYYANKKKINSIFIFLFVLLIVTMISSSTIGVVRIGFLDVVKILVSKIPIIGDYTDTSYIQKSFKTIVLNIRIPRIILAALIGAGLSAVGASFQSMFKNPMADPYVLGISSGASLGATIGISFGLAATALGFGAVSMLAFIGSMATTFFVYFIAQKGGRLNNTLLLLSGVAVGFLLNSLITILMVLNRKTMEMVVMWMMGSVSAANWKQVGIATPVIILGVLIIISFAKDLNIMAMGDATSKSLGVEVDRVKKILLVVCAFLVGVCVSVGGVIGFVGLIVPHVVRLVFGSDNRAVIPISTVVGALFLVLCNTIASGVMPFVTGSPSGLPVGAITSLFGAPFFISLLIKNKK